MAGFRLNRVFVAGVLAPVVSVVLYVIVYSALTSASRDVTKDWLFRLCVSMMAMILPGIFVIVLAVRQSRRVRLNALSKVGVAVAIVGMGLAARPVTDGLLRWRQERNMAMHDVAAPLFETVDIDGKSLRLSDQKGKVVLVNRWATWCGPCRVEMPELDELYKDRKQDGLVVYGLSDEGQGTQKRFLSKVPVSYPMLTMSNGVPGFYRDIARYPASFLIDRKGRLQTLPASGGFAGIKSEVERVLGEKTQTARP
jgi:peroxiredoxin